MFKSYTTLVDKIAIVLFIVFCMAVTFFLISPIFVIVPLSFNLGSFLLYPMEGFSLRWYEAFFSSTEWMLALRNSLVVAPLSTLLAMILGTLASVGLSRLNFRGKSMLVSFLISPMIVPVVIVGVASYLFFAPLGFSNSYFSLILVHAALGVPFVVITVSATLEGYNTNLNRAAASLGAGPLLTFFKVTLPLIAPGITSGALFAFASSFDEVVVTLFLAGPTQATLPRIMFSGIRENISPVIAVVATLLILTSVIMLVTLEQLRSRAERLRTAV